MLVVVYRMLHVKVNIIYQLNRMRLLKSNNERVLLTAVEWVDSEGEVPGKTIVRFTNSSPYIYDHPAE